MRAQRKSSLLLLELMIVLLIFSVCAVVCVGVFAKAAVDTDRTEALNSAVMISQKIIEDAKISGSTPNGGGYAYYYDRSFATAQDEEYAYKAVVVLSESENGSGLVDINFYTAGGELFYGTGSAYFIK